MHLALLLGIILLRLPGFHPDFFLPQESLALLAGQRVIDEGALYIHTWYGSPPLMAWFMAGCHALFGSATTTFLRIFSCIIIYLSAVFFHGLVYTYRPFTHTSYPVLWSFVLMACIPWFGLQLGSSLFILLPTLIAFDIVMHLGEQRTRNYSIMFQTGLIMMACMLVTYKAIFITLGLLIAYFLRRRPQFDELVSLVGGMLLTLLGVGMALFLTDSLAEFFNQGVSFYLDRLRFSVPGETFHQPLEETFLQLISHWAVFWLLGIAGFLHFRLRFFSYKVNIRGLETTMAAWFIAGLAVMAFKFKRLELQDAILMIPPLAFYVGLSLNLDFLYRIRAGVLTLGLSLSLVSYSQFAYSLTDSPDPVLQKLLDHPLIHGNIHPATIRESEALVALAAHPAPERVWIMAHRPSWYRLLELKPNTPYLDSRALPYILPALREENPLFWSRQVPDRQFFTGLTTNPPTLIIDPANYFPLLQHRFPTLLEGYQPTKVGTLTFYAAAPLP